MLIETRAGDHMAITCEDDDVLQHARAWADTLCVVRKQTRHLVLNVCKLDTVTMQATLRINYDHSGAEPKFLDVPRYEEHDLSDCVLICYDEQRQAHVVDHNLCVIESDFFQPEPTTPVGA